MDQTCRQEHFGVDMAFFKRRRFAQYRCMVTAFAPHIPFH
jgi:hypothetical protein